MCVCVCVCVRVCVCVCRVLENEAENIFQKIELNTFSKRHSKEH